MYCVWSRGPLSFSGSSCLQLGYKRSVRLIHGPKKKAEYSEVAQYPKIPTHRNDFEKQLFSLKDKTKNLGTVEEKQYFLNKPKYYGWYTCLVESSSTKPESLAFLQYVTNTTLVEGKLPDSYGKLSHEESKEGAPEASVSAIDLTARKIAEELEPILKSYIANTALHCRKGYDIENDKIPYHELFSKFPDELGVKKYDREDIDDVVRGINRIIMAHVRRNNLHLRESIIDHDPRTEGFWFRGGIRPDLRMMKRRTIWKKKAEKRQYHKMVKHLEETFEEPYDRAFQFKSQAILQLRANKMLSPFIVDIANDEICREGQVPQWNYAPQTSAYLHKFLHGVNLPGCWATSPKKFVNLAFVSRHNRDERLSNMLSWDPNSEYNSQQETILSKALVSSFAALFSSACFQGFDPFNDPTHPFTTQTIVTDGRRFKFCVSQLNKTSLVDVDEEGKLLTRNVTWHVPEVELYKSIDENGVKGFSTDVLATLVKFYLMEPTVAESDINKEGFLDEVQYIHNLKNTYNRESFTNSYRHMMSNRPRHLLRPEILAYQKLFMIDHPDQMFAAGNREQPWFRMRYSHWLGRKNWDPEFKEYDHYSKFKPAKFRTNKNDKGYKLVTSPISREDEKTS